MNHCHFSPASPDEEILYGACRPGYPSRRISADAVNEWVALMKEQGVRRVVCLLGAPQLKYYKGLLDCYRIQFGTDNILHAPVPDYTVPSADLLVTSVLPFLSQSIKEHAKTVVHCSAGVGRTGFVLLTFLTVLRGLTPSEAVQHVRASGRDPGETSDADGQRNLQTCLARWGSDGIRHTDAGL